MPKSRSITVVTGALLALSLQSCMLAPKAPDPLAQHRAVERWNSCLQRFETDIEHYCDGHRRDILATYPPYMENQIEVLLSQQQRRKRASQLLKTGI